MRTLKDQLIKASLVSEADVKRSEQEQRAQRRREGKQLSKAEKKRREDEAKARLAAEEVARREADREREAARQSERGAKEIRNRVRQIASSARINTRGPRRFYFVTSTGTIPFMQVNDAVGGQLERGQAAIVELDDGEFAVVSGDAARTIAGVALDAVRFFNDEPR